MRLGQLARKFDITPQEIIAYLKSKGITANPHPNSKLDEEAEAMVLEHFDVLPEQPEEEQIAEPEPVVIEETTDPEVVEEPEEQPIAEKITIEAESEPVSEPSGVISEKPAPVIKTVTINDILESEEEGQEIDFQLVKAAKVELDGLKVVGKIDLPEPKKKTPEEEKAEQEARELAREKRNKARGKYRQPLSDEEREKRRLKNKEWKKKREAWKAKKQKEAEEKRIKEEKEAHYRAKISPKPTAASIAKKKVTKKKKKVNYDLTPAQPKPKTVLGKIWRWLNT